MLPLLALLLDLACRPTTPKPTPGDTAASDSAPPAADSGGPGDSSPGGDSAAGETGDSYEPLGQRDLVDATLWTVLSAEDDPFADHRPDEVSCDEEIGFFVESGFLEIDTTWCGYVSATQPLLSPVRAGEVYKVLFYHTSLTAEEPAEAHVALTVDGALIWENAIAIPGISDVYSEEIPAVVDAAEGAPVVFHLHNHGSNSYNLGYLRADDP